MSDIQPVILCGGAGTRLWPLSTPSRPKQFLTLLSSDTMLTATAKRFQASLGEARFAAPIIIGSLQHEDLIGQSVPAARIVLEPFGRNSAPAIAAACLAAGEGDQLILILPADHDIRDVAAFHRAIDAAVPAARSGSILTFGIEPTHPATGYGYIRLGPGDTVHDVERFVEKPDEATAKAWLAEGGYVWNAGIFLFRADRMIEALDQHAPEILPAVRAAFPAREEGIIRLAAEAFGKAPDISIDHAVMEHARDVRVVPVSMGWSDVGGFRAIFDQLAPAPSGNVAIGPVHIRDSSGIYARSEGPTLTVSGVSNLTIVATPETVMVLPMGDDASVKIMGELVQRRRDVMTVDVPSQVRARDWLETAYTTWSDAGWDEGGGGFVEQLHPDGAPDISADRRVRVQARQVFSFARAHAMGLCNPGRALYLVEQGLDYIDQSARHPDGGFVHLLHADGQIADPRRDLYDHAFIILAAATAHGVTGNPAYLALAQDTLGFVNSRLRAPCGRGWIEGLPEVPLRRSNPHMHLLEALLSLHAVSKDASVLALADHVVGLVERHLFLCEADVLCEAFDAELRPSVPVAELAFEPGHHYEWASLLALHDRLRHRDTLSWRRRLIRQADLRGCHPQSGLAMNEVRADGRPLNPRHRAWHQLERLRAVMLHPGTSGPGTPARILDAIFRYYLDGMPPGTWKDEIDASGHATRAEIPASMLYHFTTAFETMMEPGLPPRTSPPAKVPVTVS